MVKASMENESAVSDLKTWEEVISWKQESELFQSQVDSLQKELLELKFTIQSDDDAKCEKDLLRCKVGTISTLLTHLKRQAKNMALTQHSSEANQGDDMKLKSKEGTVLSECLSFFESWANETPLTNDRASSYAGDILKSVSMVTDIMESLVKRVIVAESEVANEKEKVNMRSTELRMKTFQIDRMSAKVTEMETFAACTNDKLNEIRQKVEHIVQETFRLKQNAAENELELSRVKRDFQTLMSYVDHLVRSREESFSSENQVHSRDAIDRILEKNSRLENEKVEKEAEVQKLMDENVRLSNILDKKEAQLLAMNVQCKFMALNKS